MAKLDFRDFIIYPVPFSTNSSSGIFMRLCRRSISSPVLLSIFSSKSSFGFIFSPELSLVTSPFVSFFMSDGFLPAPLFFLFFLCLLFLASGFDLVFAGPIFN